MLQRIQTVYLFIAALISSILILVFSLWTNTEGEAVYAEDILWLFAAFMLSALLSIITIFLFKNRKLQFVLGRINILLNFFLLGVFVYWMLMTPGEMQISEKGVGVLIPVLSIVFIVMANKAIKKDEDLVKSVDRLR